MTIYCLENNYGVAEDISSPQIFTLPSACLLPEGGSFIFDSFNDHELYGQSELVIRISRGGMDIGADVASEYFDSITTGISFTSLDIQKVLNGLGISWQEAKDWRYSRVAGNFFAPAGVDPDHLHFCIYQNREQSQMGYGSDMIWNLCEVVAQVSARFRLAEGDLIFCGSPGGFFPVSAGDSLEAFFEDDSAVELVVQES